MKKIIIISLAMLFVLTVCRASTLNKINSQFTEEIRQETVEKSEKEKAILYTRPSGPYRLRDRSGGTHLPTGKEHQ